MRRVLMVTTVLAMAGALCTACTPPPVALGPKVGLPYGVSIQRNLSFETRDGRTLRADVYAPTDPGTGDPAPGPFPVILGFTPYGKSGASNGFVTGGNGVDLDLVRQGYLAAVVDVPGTGGSEGRFDLFDHAEAVAGADAVWWASRLPGSNGNVGMIGESYLAIVQLFTAAEIGPGSPLKAIFPEAATVDAYRDLFTSGGALNVMSPLGLLFGYGLTRIVSPWTELADDLPEAARRSGENLDQLSHFEAVFAHDMLTNGPRRYDSAYWQQRAPRGVLERIVDNGIAVYLTGGLYDVFQRGEPLLYSGLQNAAAGRPVDAPMAPDQVPSGRYQLLTGPWHHGKLAKDYDLRSVALAWFDRWLKGIDNGIDETTTPLHVVEPAGDRYDAGTYPLSTATTRRLWLRAGRRLDAESPAMPEAPDRIDFTFSGDTCSASTVQFSAGLFEESCPTPRLKPDAGPGEVTYSTPPLDGPLRLAGPITLALHATSTRPDALFAVTLEDVGPDGTATDVTGGAQLGSLRTLDPATSWPGIGGAWLRPELKLTAADRRDVPVGEVVRYDVEIRPAFVSVPAGHRIRLRIASSDSPHLVPLADLSGLAFGRYDIHHDPAAPSFLDLSVLPA